jgi:hypothetical protein
MNQTFAILLYILSFSSFAQTELAGRWLGVITQTGSNNVASSYYFEMNFKIDSTQNISGTTYSYLRKESGKYILKANFTANSKNNELIFKELAMIEYENTIQKRADYCIKSGTLQFVTENNKMVLKGEWNGKEHKTDNPCAGGTILLEKFLPDTTSGVAFNDEKPIQLQGREIKKGKSITVHSTTLKIEIFDDADEDDDMISLNFNGKWLAKKYKLKNQPLQRTIHINPTSPFNFISTLAHNLGKMPPNTTALLIDDGKKKQKVVLKSDMNESDILYLEYEAIEKK